MAITSLTNPTVRRVRRLGKRAWRERRRQVLLEGRRTVATALAAGIALPEVLSTDGGDELLSQAREAGSRVHTVARDVMAHLTDEASAPSVLAIGPLFEATVDGVVGSSALLLDGVKDPAAVGGLIASAAAAGLGAVVAADGTADPFDPKVIRAAGGAHYLVRVVRRVSADLACDRLRTDARVVTLGPDGIAPWEVDLAGPIVLRLGGGADGIRVTLPGRSAEPPLTAAAAVVLYEWVRQGGDAR